MRQSGAGAVVEQRHSCRCVGGIVRAGRRLPRAYLYLPYDVARHSPMTILPRLICPYFVRYLSVPSCSPLPNQVCTKRSAARKQLEQPCVRTRQPRDVGDLKGAFVDLDAEVYDEAPRGVDGPRGGEYRGFDVYLSGGPVSLRIAGFSLVVAEDGGVGGDASSSSSSSVASPSSSSLAAVAQPLSLGLIGPSSSAQSPSSPWTSAPGPEPSTPSSPATGNRAVGLARMRSEATGA